MVQIAVVDDEKQNRELLLGLVERYCPDCRTMLFESGRELAAASEDFDIIFLDIRLNGENGVDTARELRSRGCGAVLIFVTAFKEYVFEAFDVSAFHYLLKPVEEEKFSRVFARALAGVRRKKERAGEVLLVRAGGKSFALRRDAIRYVENCAKRVEIHADGKIYEIYAAMSRLEKELGESFYRCHRGYLVNLEHVAEYTNDSILLDSGECVFLAKERYRAFVKAYLRYLRGEGCGDV